MRTNMRYFSSKQMSVSKSKSEKENSSEKANSKGIYMFEEVGKEIANYFSTIEAEPSGWANYSGFRVIVCGSSGSGKTRSIRHANELLPEHGRIAESSMALAVIKGRPIEELLAGVKDRDLEYACCSNIAFTMMDRRVAEKLGRLANLPVFCLEE